MTIEPLLNSNNAADIPRRNGENISKEKKTIAAESQELKLSNNPWRISRPFWTPRSSTPLR